MRTAQKINLVDFLGRLRNILLASIFVLTQLMVPLSFATQAVASGSVPVGSSLPISEKGVTPTLYEGGQGGNVSCEQLGFNSGTKRNDLNGSFKYDWPAEITNVDVTDDTYVSWSASIGIGAVIVKGSNSSNVYEYSPSENSDLGLASPINFHNNDPSKDKPYELSNLTFCWDVEDEPEIASLTIEKQVTEGSDVVEDFTFNITGEDELDDSFDLAHGEETEDDYHNIPVGTYTITENMNLLEGWKLPVITCDPETAIVGDITGSSVTVELEDGDDVTCTFTNEQEVDEPVQSFTILAHSVVCDNEALLPNWAGGGPGDTVGPVPSTISDTTAQDYVDQSDGDCWLESGWDFQWGFEGAGQHEGAHKLPGDHTGLADGTESSCSFNCGTHTDTGEGFNDWKTFDTSTANDGTTPAEAVIDSESEFDGNGIWVREVLKDGYVPFTLPPQDSPMDNVSAEIYCHQDIAKYDNFDLVANPEFGNTYYCVAFNAPKDNPRITVVKETLPPEFDQDFDFTLNGEELTTLNASSNSSETFVREPGDYSLAEVANVPGWNLVDAECSYQNERSSPFDPRETDITLELEDHVECTFVNERLTTLTVIKEADPQTSQEFDFTVQEVFVEQQQARTGVQFAETMMSQIVELPGDLYFESFSLIDDGISDEDSWTDEVEPGEYLITEDLPIGWTLENINCNEHPTQLIDVSSVMVQVDRHDQVECTFVNTMDELVLELDKDNDADDVRSIGDIVTYTLTLTVPEDQGVSYNTVVRDIAPENFAVDNASTQSRLVEGTEHPSRSNPFGNPGGTYSSPGVWELGTVYPGEVIVMTYEATITDEVTPGTYPDIAYAQGGTVPIEAENETVYSNVHLASADDPFVGTAVTVQEGEVLGVQTLARTGSPISIFNAAVPILLITLAGALLRRETKGAL